MPYEKGQATGKSKRQAYMPMLKRPVKRSNYKCQALSYAMRKRLLKSA